MKIKPEKVKTYKQQYLICLQLLEHFSQNFNTQPVLKMILKYRISKSIHGLGNERLEV